MQLLIEYDDRNWEDGENLRCAQEVIDDTLDIIECFLAVGLKGVLVETHTSDLIHEHFLVEFHILNHYDSGLFIIVVGISFVFDLDHVNISNILIELLSLFFFFLEHLILFIL